MTAADLPYRYRVGCAGMFVLGMDYGMDNEDEAIVACEAGPPGCEVYDTETNKWIGPTCQEDIDDAKARLASRVTVEPIDVAEIINDLVEEWHTGDSDSNFMSTLA